MYSQDYKDSLRNVRIKDSFLLIYKVHINFVYIKAGITKSFNSKFSKILGLVKP